MIILNYISLVERQIIVTTHFLGVRKSTVSRGCYKLFRETCISHSFERSFKPIPKKIIVNLS